MRLLIALSALLISSLTWAANPLVRLQTSMGNITIELFPEQAPETVENILRYVDEGFYDGTVFHRVVPGFVIQGGGFDRDLQQKKTHAPIKNEADNGLKNERGTLSMARTSNPDSGTSQFFVNLKDNAMLDHTAPTPRGWGYAVFGKVVDGMDTVDRIAKVRTGVGRLNGAHSVRDVPSTPVIIERAVRLDEDGQAD
ncbi:Peptidyl-prolyl cis-trans isomerase ppiB [Alloalcanivorax xenomutans]|jgi:peptidyl-prolyl cis-trans isomerase A (cyclophilin A)|uniref:peptidylprolyl isomerase n=1 Tax=Alloalcanivorax xenomutans TaxID=1094342 RepID=UPI0006D5BFDC|nr:peptidylprolyl isomerase [Alloalcanivorax xenomutans]CUR47166.1 Peptidyl-prolyl cis-trans isomerase ppiB [Alloalcanivorax xenomutans]